VYPSNASKPKNTNHSGRHIGLTSDDQRRMVELYNGGQSCQKIADLFGCSRSKVSETLHKLGVKLRPVVRIPKEKHPRIVQFYNAGQTCKEIAGGFGCFESCIYRIQKKILNVSSTQFQPRYTEQDHQCMVSMYEKGKSLQEIAEEIGCVPATVIAS